jgi:Amt family ammonium transporter
MNGRSVNAALVTILAASSAGCTWVLLEAVTNFSQRKVSLNAFCTGVIAGLVAITPACGFVNVSSSLVIGLVGEIERFGLCK